MKIIIIIGWRLFWEFFRLFWFCSNNCSL